MSKDFDLTVFPIHQRIIIASLLEEAEWLKERVESLEKDRDEINERWGDVFRECWKGEEE